MPSESQSAVSDGAGGLRTTFRPRPFLRRVVRVVIVGPSSTRFRWYVGSLMDASIVDSTNNGDNNSNDYPNGIDVPPGYLVYGTWVSRVGASLATGSATMTLTYDKAE